MSRRGEEKKSDEGKDNYSKVYVMRKKLKNTGKKGRSEGEMTISG